MHILSPVMTTALLETAEIKGENDCDFMIDLHGSYMAEQRFELTTPGSAVRCATNCFTEPSTSQVSLSIQFRLQDKTDIQINNYLIFSITHIFGYSLEAFLMRNHNICFHGKRRETFEPAHDKTYKMACAPSKDSDQPGHLPSLIRLFAVHMKKAWVLSYPLSAQQRL